MLNLSDISLKQMDKMKGALGLRYEKKPYRNYYQVTGTDYEWEDLIEKGFAGKFKGNNEGSTVYYLYHDAVELVYGKKVSKKKYNEL